MKSEQIKDSRRRPRSSSSLRWRRLRPEPRTGVPRAATSDQAATIGECALMKILLGNG